MKLDEIMTRQVEVVAPESSIRDAASKMQSLDVGLLPVCNGDRVLGMVTDRDITIRATARGADPSTTKVSEVMTSDVVYCFEDDSTKDASEKMAQHQIRRLIVLTKDKRLAGIVSLGDLATEAGNDKRAGNTLEAISEPSQPRR